MLTNQQVIRIVFLNQRIRLFCIFTDRDSVRDRKEVSMLDRFEKLTAGVTQIYKCIQRIKKHKMNTLGLKGTHVMCIYYLSIHPDGLTAAELSRICLEDKASISRILSDLDNHGFIHCTQGQEAKKYRAVVTLTESGKAYAQKVNDLILHVTLEGGTGLTDQEREIFYRVLFQISDNLTCFLNQLEKE